jgi:uncharacterized membrane protein
VTLLLFFISGGLAIAGLAVAAAARSRALRAEQRVSEAERHINHLFGSLAAIEVAKRNVEASDKPVLQSAQVEPGLPEARAVETPAAEPPPFPPPRAPMPAPAWPGTAWPPGPVAPHGQPWPTMAAPVAQAPSPGQAYPLPQPSAHYPPPASPRVSGDLEQKLGARWAVWIGGVALAVGALLLVRYSIELGYFGPATRIAFGALLALALAGAAEVLRGRKPAAHERRFADVPSVLTAAATVAALGTTYAAHALYGFLDSTSAFLLLAVLGLIALLAALRHGTMQAAVGLVAANVAPMLVSSGEPNPWPVVGFLAVVSVGAQALSRLMNARWISLAAAGGAAAWGIVFIVSEPFSKVISQWLQAGMAHTIIQTGIAAVAAMLMPWRGAESKAPSGGVDWALAGMQAALSMLALVMIGLKPALVAPWVAFAAALPVILIVSAMSREAASPAAALAGLLILVTLLAWPSARPASFSHMALAQIYAAPDAVSGYSAFAFALTAILLATSVFRLANGSDMPAAAFHLAAGTLVPPLALLIAYLRITGLDRSLAFGAIGAGLAVVLAACSLLVDNRRDAKAGRPDRLAGGVFAAAAMGAVCLALAFVLERGFLTMALALAALGSAVLATSRKVTILRYVTATIGFVVLVRLMWDPAIFGPSVGGWPVLNWLLPGYGVPALAFAGAAWLLRKEREDAAVRIADGLSVLLSALLVVFEIRHALGGGQILRASSDHVEQGLLAVTGMGFAYVLARLDDAKSNPVYHWAARGLLALSGLVILVNLGVLFNPLLWPEPVLGRPVLSSLAIGYLMPAAAAALAMRLLRKSGATGFAHAAGAMAVLLLFAYVSLEVRHVFQGSPMELSYSRRPGDMELWAYSAAWLVFGLALLGYGILRQYREARIASGAFVLLAVLKVFLLDLGGLSGIWRAVSFIGLGLVLIGIGLLYQKLVFAKPKEGMRAEPPPLPPRAFPVSHSSLHPQDGRP